MNSYMNVKREIKDIECTRCIMNYDTRYGELTSILLYFVKIQNFIIYIFIINLLKI